MYSVRLCVLSEWGHNPSTITLREGRPLDRSIARSLDRSITRSIEFEVDITGVEFIIFDMLMTSTNDFGDNECRP